MERDTRDGKETMEDPGNVEGDRGPPEISRLGYRAPLERIPVFQTSIFGVPGRLECPVVDSLRLSDSRSKH